jgi:hypothetical protein
VTAVSVAWDARPGSFWVRASCPRCGSDMVPVAHELAAMCPRGCPGTKHLCLDRFGWKSCCRTIGHEGLHVSPSGSAWQR